VVILYQALEIGPGLRVERLRGEFHALRLGNATISRSASSRSGTGAFIPMSRSGLTETTASPPTTTSASVPPSAGTEAPTGPLFSHQAVLSLRKRLGDSHPDESLDQGLR
jgi:hypothetical protein